MLRHHDDRSSDDGTSDPQPAAVIPHPTAAGVVGCASLLRSTHLGVVVGGRGGITRSAQRHAFCRGPRRPWWY